MVARTLRVLALLYPALLYLVIFAAGEAHAEAPPCRVELRVEPARPFVGQQMLYRARIMRREDVDEDVAKVEWVQPLAFPNLRAQWLPGRAEDTRVTRGGARYRVREDQRALFSPWAGRNELPTFELACAGMTIRVPGPVLDVRALPERGRPADFTGVVGSLVVQASVDQNEIGLGQSVRVSVLARGDANLWDLPPPFEDLDGPDVEVFPHEPELNLEAGERLYVRRYFRFDFVPRNPGPFEVPAVRVAYYDASAGRYAHSETEPIAVAVAPRKAGDAARTRQIARDAPDEMDESHGTTALAVALLVGAALLAGGAWHRVRTARANHAEIDRALQQATRCGEGRDRPGQAAALGEALSRAAAIAKRERLAEAEIEIADHLARLEQIRFSAEAIEPRAEIIAALIDRLTARSA